MYAIKNFTTGEIYRNSVSETKTEAWNKYLNRTKVSDSQVIGLIQKEESSNKFCVEIDYIQAWNPEIESYVKMVQEFNKSYRM